MHEKLWRYEHWDGRWGLTSRKTGNVVRRIAERELGLDKRQVAFLTVRRAVYQDLKDAPGAGVVVPEGDWSYLPAPPPPGREIKMSIVQNAFMLKPLIQPNRLVIDTPGDMSCARWMSRRSLGVIQGRHFVLSELGMKIREVSRKGARSAERQYAV